MSHAQPGKDHTENLLIESHSFDYVPHDLRHGSAGKQFPFWFMLNATLITLFTGAIGPVAGLSLVWSVVAIVSGSVAGTFFQAFHAAQGPRMGLPQMIQSRVQFGSWGAVVPLLATVLTTGGFGIFYIQLAGNSLVEVTDSSQLKTFEVVCAVIGTAIAIIGYRLVHRIERWLSLVMVTNLALLTLAVLVEIPSGTLFDQGTFLGVAFIAQFGAAMSYQIAIAPIVSDYTRYLPARTGTGPVVAAVFGGTLASALWLETLGAAISTAYPGQDVVAGIAAVGDQFGLRLGQVTLLIAVVVTTSIMAATMYSAAINTLSIGESFFFFRSTAALRATVLVVEGALVLGGALFLSSDFLANFGSFLSILSYLLIPWTAVSLVDFYLVRRGRYSITDIVQPGGGIYGRWNWRGLTSYGLGIVVMIPFFSNGLWTGPIADQLSGADIAPIVGLPVAAFSYWWLMRSYDLAAEIAVVEQQPTRSVPIGDDLIRSTTHDLEHRP